MSKNFFKKNKNLILLTGAILLIAFILIFALVILPAIKNKKAFEVTDVKIQINGIHETDFEIPIDGGDVSLSVVINGGAVNYKKHRQPEIRWEFKGNNMGCAIENGILKTGGCDTLGSTAIEVKVKSKNEISAEVALRVTPKKNSAIQSIELTGSGESKKYIEGQHVDKGDFAVTAFFGDYSAKVIDFLTDKQSFSLEDRELQITYSYGDVEKYLIVPVSVVPKSLQSIRITRAPDNTAYKEGQYFDSTGMEITADYEYSSEIVFDYFFDGDKILTTDDSAIIFYYSENHPSKGIVTKTAEQKITVNRRILQNISVDTSKAKLNYVQGQRFDASGLVVTALYDVGEQIVDGYAVDTQTKLTSGLTDWKLSYTENGVTETFAIRITVDAPYTDFRQIIFEDYPNDATLSWFYFYTTDEGEDKIDNTAASENGLAFNNPVGTYMVPVGADVTIEAVNPAITDFYLDGKAQGLKYPSRTVSFTLRKGEDPLRVSFKKIGNRADVSFNGEAAKITFSYPQPWNGSLKEDHLKQISLVFDESSDYCYNVYVIDGAELLFSELSAYRFTNGCEVSVVRRERENGTLVALVYWEGVEALVTVDKNDAEWQSKLPEPERVGYRFLGWEEQDGKMVAQWNLQDACYSGVFIGKWSYEVVATVTAECFFTFNSNGTYGYETYIDGELNLKLYGFYEYDAAQNSISVLSVESNFDLLLVSPGDFEIDLDNLLKSKLFVAEGYNLYQYDALFVKAVVNN